MWGDNDFLEPSAIRAQVTPEERERERTQQHERRCRSFRFALDPHVGFATESQLASIRAHRVLLLDHLWRQRLFPLVEDVGVRGAFGIGASLQFRLCLAVYRRVLLRRFAEVLGQVRQFLARPELAFAVLP